jgi:hypothetical protein
MQLKDVRIHKNALYLKIDASMKQWLELLHLTQEDFEKVHDGSVFKLIKFMNAKVEENE